MVAGVVVSTGGSHEYCRIMKIFAMRNMSWKVSNRKGAQSDHDHIANLTPFKGYRMRRSIILEHTPTSPCQDYVEFFHRLLILFQLLASASTSEIVEIVA